MNRTIRSSLSSMLMLMLSAQVLPAADDDDDRKPAAQPAATAPRATAHSDGAAGADVVKLSPEIIEHYHIATGPVERLVAGEAIMASASVGFDTDTVVDVGVQLSGRVQGITVHLGDAVGVGDELLTIESQDLGQAQNALIEKVAARATAEADEALARATWERSKPLIDDHTISTGEAQRRENDLRKAETALMVAKAGVVSAENSLRLLGMDPSGITELEKSQQVSPRLVIRARAKGTVIARSVTLGETVRPDQDALLVIADTSHYWVVANVPVSAAQRVRPGDAVRITANGIAGAITAKIDFVPPALDQQSHTLPVRINVPADSGLRPGMFASASISARDEGAEPVVVVPTSAMFSYGGGNVVFVPVGETPGGFRPKRIVTGPPEGDVVPIVSGLEAGEQIVITGGFIIKAQLSKGPADED